MENNLENKARLFAQYWGSTVSIGGKLFDLNSIDYDEWLEDAFIMVTPPSLITDEDAIEVSRILDSNFRKPLDEKYHTFHADRGRSHILPSRPCRSDVADYLRSKGYALQYLDLTVEEQVNRGWVRLIE